MLLFHASRYLYVLRYQDAYFEQLASKFVPADYVYAVLNSRPDIWVNRECKHLHSITCPIPHKQVPQVGSINKQAAKAGNPAFDKEAMTLSYANLKMTSSARFIDGAEQVFPYEIYDNPCVYSKHGSGVIETDMVVLDFNGWGSITYKK